MRIFLLTLICILTFSLLPGQERNVNQPILLRGVVISALSGDRLPNVQIIRNGEKAKVTGGEGTFSLYAFRKDTVIFSCLGFKPLSLIVPDTLRGNEFVTGVYMNTDTLEIGEVIILPGLRNLKAAALISGEGPSRETENARNNVSIAAYQGRTGQGRLGDPATNYEILRQRQRIDAYEKGGIPSDKIAGISPLLLIPAAYMLIKGKPDTPEAPEPSLSKADLERIAVEYKRAKNQDVVRRDSSVRNHPL
jgi:hypothetical protein